MQRLYLKIGPVAGVPVWVHVGWLPLAGVTAWLASSYYVSVGLVGAAGPLHWLVGLSVAVLFVGMVLLHELSHAWVARSLGLPLRRVTLTLTGGALKLDDHDETPGAVFLIALAGPASTLGVALLCGLVYRFAGTRWPVLSLSAHALRAIALTLGLLNLLPALPLDGGQALRAAVWFLSGDGFAATVWAARLGRWVGSAMTIVGLFMWLARDVREWAWLAAVGLLAEGSARAAYRNAQVRQALEGLAAVDVMLRHCVPLDPSLTLDALDSHLAERQVPCLIVGDQQGVYGILTPRRLRRVSRRKRSCTTLSEVMLPLSEAAAITPETPLVQVLERLGELGVEELPVMRDGRLLGVVERHEIMRLIQGQTSLV